MMTIKTSVVNTSAICIAIFLVAASTNAQPMISPKAAFAQNSTSTNTQTGSSGVAGPCPPGMKQVGTGPAGCLISSTCPTGSSVMKATKLCEPSGTTPECPSFARNLGPSGFLCSTTPCPSGNTFNPRAGKCEQQQSTSSELPLMSPSG